jgi:predicted RNase H-like HicB family nuclease
MQKQVLNYRVIIQPEKYDDGSTVYTAYCPTLGVADYGDTIEEVLASIKDGIELAIESMAREGEEIPTDLIEKQIITTASVSVPKKFRVALT